MKKYTIGLITGTLLALSAMMFMGAQNNNGNLKEYCGQDTLAMVEIHNVLKRQSD